MQQATGGCSRARGACVGTQALHKGLEGQPAETNAFDRESLDLRAIGFHHKLAQVGMDSQANLLSGEHGAHLAGRLMTDEDDLEQGIALLQEGVALAREGDDKPGLAWALFNLGAEGRAMTLEQAIAYALDVLAEQAVLAAEHR